MRRKFKLNGYYSGKYSIFHKNGRENTKVNNKIVSNFDSHISNISIDFFNGQPMVYKYVADEKGLATLLDIFRYNDEQAHNLALIKHNGRGLREKNTRMATVP